MWRLGFVPGLVAAALVGACDATLVNPRVPPRGSSPAFEDGYIDGCLTGFSDAGRDGYELSRRKDEARFVADPEYRGGFQQAYIACFEEEKRHPRILGDHGADRVR
jgi:hypothetical protein